jgi:hypothetical protein
MPSFSITSILARNPRDNQEMEHYKLETLLHDSGVLRSLAAITIAFFTASCPMSFFL